MKKLSLFILVYIGWVMLTWIPSRLDYLSGIVVSALIAFEFGDEFFISYWILFSLKRLFYFIGYVFYLLFELAKGSVISSFRVLNPWDKHVPGIIKIHTDLKEATSKAFLANSITLSVDTLTIDVIESDLYVHWLNVLTKNEKAATEQVVKRFEDLARRIFE